MKEIVFPTTGQRVVPLLTVTDNDELTSVHAPKNKYFHREQKVWFLRIVIGKLFRATLVRVAPEDGASTKRE